MQTYVPLHNHSHGSTLDGFATPLEHAKKTFEDGGVALGLTDHGECGQHGQLNIACATYGLKPIFGTEAYFVDDVKLSRERKDKPSDFSHGCLWAIDNEGLKNLWTLSTYSYDKDHHYYKPRMDWALLSKYSKGLAVSDGCLLAEVARAVNDDDDQRAEDYLLRMVSIFGKENVFVELHTWQFCEPEDESQVELNRQMTKANHGKLRIANKLGLKTIAVNDAHYAEKEDYVYHELVWNSHTGKGKDVMADTLSDTGESLGRGQTASWLMNEEEVRYWLAKHGLPESAIDESIQNTWDFAQRCTAKLDARPRYPHITGDKEKDIELFNRTIEEGFARKVPKGQEALYRERVEYEKDVILEKGFEGYFNVVSDFSRYTKEKDPLGIRGGIPGKQEILMAPARGSSGGSLVSYLMDIIEMDPVALGAPFERFLSRARGMEEGVKLYFADITPLNFKRSDEQSKLEPGDIYLGHKITSKAPAFVGDFPDIDSDFPSSFGGQLIDYLRYRYGETSVARIGTLQTSQARNVFKDFARSAGVDYRTANTISRMFPEDIGPHYFEDEESLEKLYKENEDLRQHSGIIEKVAPHMRRMVGRIRQFGAHASGYVIADESLIGQMPLRYRDGELITQFQPGDIATQGFIKYDILKIKALDILQSAAKAAIEERQVARAVVGGKTIYFNVEDINKYPNAEVLTEYTNDIFYVGANNDIDDPGTWESTRKGDSLGIFQLETRGGTRMAKNMQIMNLHDAAVLSAVNRPGMTRSGLASNFFKRKDGLEEVTYPHPFLEGVVGKTFGFFVFQEDVMRLFTEMAGYTLEEADTVRKIVTKKDFEQMASLKRRLLEHSKRSKEFVENMPSKYTTVEECVEDIWRMIEHTVAYAFNFSHSCGYAYVGGWQAWMKKNFLTAFLKASLSHNPGELKTYAAYAKQHGIRVLPPDINKSKHGFAIEGKNIRAPLSIIANVGPKAENEALAAAPFSSVEDFEEKTSGRGARRANVYKNLIIAGAFDSLHANRKELLDRFFASKGIVDAEGNPAPDIDLSSKALIAKAEETVMGHSFYFDPMSQVEDALKVPAISSSEELEEISVGQRFATYGKAISIRPHKAKNGTMAWVTIEMKDSSQVSVTMFAETYQSCAHLFDEGDVILLNVARDNDFRGEKSLIANEMINMTQYLV